jgi:hypothetical protein
MPSPTTEALNRLKARALMIDKFREVSVRTVDLQLVLDALLAERARVEKMREGLDDADRGLVEAINRFREYAASHAAKGTPEGDEKAARNTDMAYTLECCRPARSLLEEGLGSSSSTEHSPSGRPEAQHSAGGKDV